MEEEKSNKPFEKGAGEEIQGCATPAAHEAAMGACTGVAVADADADNKDDLVPRYPTMAYQMHAHEYRK